MILEGAITEGSFEQKDGNFIVVLRTKKNLKVVLSKTIIVHGSFEEFTLYNTQGRNVWADYDMCNIDR